MSHDCIMNLLFLFTLPPVFHIQTSFQAFFVFLVARMWGLAYGVRLWREIIHENARCDDGKGEVILQSSEETSNVLS